MAKWVSARALQTSQFEAGKRLQELSDAWADGCLATGAMGDGIPARSAAGAPSHCPEIVAVLTAAGPPQDDRPCIHCGSGLEQELMILCDRCNHCYHRNCAADSGGT